MYQDRGPREEFEVTCAECGAETTVPFKPSGDRPVKCRDCFRKDRPQRSDRGDREMFDVTCAECGIETQVPFKPSGDRPVKCRDCFQKDRPPRGGPRGGGAPRGDREMFDVTCAECGTKTQVPFKPTGSRPVYCRDCFRR